MIPLRNGAAALILMWIAGGFQAVLAPAIAIASVGPNFPIVVLAVSSLALSRGGSTALGFLAGLLEAGISGVGMAGLTISRAIVGFGLGSVRKFEFDANFLVAAASAFFATIIAQFLYLFLDPPSNLLSFVLVTIGTATYNGVIAIPLYLAVARVFHVRRD